MAKKAPSTLLNMFLSLTLITVVAGAALALVSGVTEEPIAQAKKNKKEAALQAVVPGFDRIEAQSLPVSADDKARTGLKADSLVCYFAYAADNQPMGVAVETASENGYGGHLGIMVGFDVDGNILGYQVLETSETPGLGAKAGEWFQKGNKGDVIGKTPGTSGLSVKKDGGEVDAISGSTITSRAFCAAVSIAYNTAFQKGE